MRFVGASGGVIKLKGMVRPRRGERTMEHCGWQLDLKWFELRSDYGNLKSATDRIFRAGSDPDGCCTERIGAPIQSVRFRVE
jgi:hypothetical protein